MIHRGNDVHFVTNGGQVMTSGYSTQLANGVVGLFDMGLVTAQGFSAVNSFVGKPKNTKYVFKRGVHKLSPSRTRTNKADSSVPFTLSDVKSIHVSSPSTSKNSVDEFRVGYDGLNAETKLSFLPGDNVELDIQLSGQAIGMLGYPSSSVTTKMQFLVPECNTADACTDCDPCANVNAEEIVNKAIKDYLETGGGTGLDLSPYIEVKAIKSTNTALSGTEYTFRTLTVIDGGDSIALANVQAQYPAYKVERTNRVGLTSTYTAIAPEATAFAAYTQGLASIIKGCDACPSGYTATQAGFVYAIQLEDDGASLLTSVDDLAGFVTGTAVKWSQDGGLGLYTVVTNDAVTSAEITTFVTAYPTATVELVGQVSEVCANATTTSTAWVVGESCFASSHEYTITVPDDECGTNKLAALQAAYPSLTVAIYQTGDPLANVAGGCMTKYVTNVVTNIECTECTDAVRGLFLSTAPAAFEGIDWTQTPVDTDSSALMGISIKGKETILYPDEYMRSEVPFINDGIRLSVAGGYPQELYYNFKTYNNRWNVKVMSVFAPKENLGGNLWGYEATSNRYLRGVNAHTDNYTKAILGEESFLAAGEQVVDYIVEVERVLTTQGFGGRQVESFYYHFVTPVGKHSSVETMVNKLATAAGLAPVQAYGK